MIYADHIELLVAELNNKVIGCGYARIEDAKHYPQHPQHAYLGFKYVSPPHRSLDNRTFKCWHETLRCIPGHKAQRRKPRHGIILKTPEQL